MHLGRKMRNISTLAIGALFLSISGSAGTAATWDLTTVLTGTGVSGFDASWFHEASSSSAMSGAKNGKIVGPATGTYNDTTGALSLTLTVDKNWAGPSDLSTFTLNTNASALVFTALGTSLTSPGTADVQFAGGVTLNGLNATTIGFKSGFLGCCSSGSNGPNSFLVNGSDPTVAVMTLWGANGFNPSGNGSYSSASLGIDLRLQFAKITGPGPGPSPVPIPAIFPLFAAIMGLVGFVGWRRRRTAATA